jgi:hypothetical protein
MVSNRTYLTPRQISARWHWHPESVRRKLRTRRDRLPCLRIGGRLLIDLAVVERFEAEHSTAAYAPWVAQGQGDPAGALVAARASVPGLGPVQPAVLTTQSQGER